MPSHKKISTTQSLVSATGSAIAITVLIRTITKELAPFCSGFNGFFFKTLQKLVTNLSPTLTMVIEEFNDLTPNQIYSAAEIYINSKCLTSTKIFKISKGENQEDYVFSANKKEDLTDVFEGVRFKWLYGEGKIGSHSHTRPVHDLQSNRGNAARHYELSFHKKHKEKVLNSYLPYIINVAKTFKEETRVVKLHTTMGSGNQQQNRGPWSSIILNHPATFEKLAMDDAQKKMIVDDLDKFVKRKEFYRGVGKAWKRGYLLYGPPGTGKSTLIAAMANYLKFDIYDLELTTIKGNSDFRKLLVSTANRSILVIEDIDCSLDFKNSRQKMYPGVALDQIDYQLTLSGMLNFIDGLWSSCGNERIIVFTTNNKDRLDPALLRPGRMDVHVHMSYCTPSGFKLLAYNYLKVCDHPAFEEIEALLKVRNMTPAEVAEALMMNDDPDITLGGLVRSLKERHLPAQVKENAAIAGKETE